MSQSKLKTLMLSVLMIMLLGVELNSSARAQNKVVVIPLFDSTPTGVGAIPFYCSEVILVSGASSSNNVTCRRSDSRAIVTPVPAGQLFLVTDVVVRANALVTSGTAAIRYGRTSLSSNYPVDPRQTIRVKFPDLNHLNLSTPYVVLRPGERLGAYNFDTSPTGVNANVSFSGYLIPASTFGQ